MAGFNKSNRLSPPLMWAFRSAAEQRDARGRAADKADLNGRTAVASRKGTTAASITEPILRREVWRDIEHLLNTVALESTVKEVRTLHHVRYSIINFGLPDIVHRSIDELLGSDRAIEREMESALRTYEPRLIPETISVKLEKSVDTVGLKVRFVVKADLLCRPVDIPLEFTAEVEAISGKIVLNRL